MRLVFVWLVVAGVGIGGMDRILQAASPQALEASPHAPEDEHSADAFPGGPFDQVFAQLAPPSKDRESPRERPRVELSAKQTRFLLDRVNSAEAWGGTQSRCHIPQFLFTFMHDGREIAELSVCMSCNNALSETPIPARPTSAMSPSFRADLRKLCRRLGIGGCEHGKNSGYGD